MRVSLISCLLIGSITCGPVGKGYQSNSFDTTFMRQPFSSGYWFSGTGVNSYLGSSSLPPSLPYPSSDKATELPAQDVISSAGPGSYSSNINIADSGYTSFMDERYNIPEVGEYGFAYAASQSNRDDGSAPDGSYGRSSSAYIEDNSFVVAPQDENWSSGSATSYGAIDENPEPVFSDVSDLEPVYSFSSHSSYQRGRAVFAQTRYTPGEPVPPLMPVSASAKLPQSIPAEAPIKGGF